MPEAAPVTRAVFSIESPCRFCCGHAFSFRVFARRCVLRWCPRQDSKPATHELGTQRSIHLSYGGRRPSAELGLVPFRHGPSQLTLVGTLAETAEGIATWIPMHYGR